MNASSPRSTALIVDASESVTTLLASYVRLAVGTGAETAHDLHTLRRLLQDRPERFFVAAVDFELPDADRGEAIDFVLGHNIPVVAMTASDIADREAFIDKNVIDFVFKSSASEIENATNAIHRVYNNRFVRVLVVDESSSYRHYLRNLLRMHEYQTLEAESAEQALKALEDEHDIHLVIVNDQLPDMNGVQLINAIRKHHNRRELPVLGMSQTGDERLPSRMLKSGANDYLGKPMVVDEFYCRVAHCIETTEYIRVMEESATRDYLTRAYNRRYLFETGTRLHENAKRGNLTLSVAMIDADEFKRVNDTHGHHVGDVVLKEISATLSRCLRQSDLVARFGGEEFCVLATGLNRKGALNVFERVRRDIAAMPVCVGAATVRITVSIGVCMSLEDSLESMIKRADEALYRAKSQGRDRVVIAAQRRRVTRGPARPEG